MIKEINYLKEHLYEIYKYKKSQKDLTYDMDLELLLRTCKALDFIQKENNQLQTNWNILKELIEKEKTRLAKECSHTYEDSLGKTKLVNEDIFNELNKISNRMNELEKRRQ